MSDYTATGIIASLKLRGFVPTGTGLTTDQILQVLTEECGLYITAFLKGIREEYLVTTVDLPMAASIRMPGRAVGGALRSAMWLDDSGNEHPLSRIEPERRNMYATSGSGVSGYVFRANTLSIVPPTATGTARLAYQQRLGQLVLATSCGLIQSVGASSVTLTGTPPAGFVTGASFDVVSGTPNFETRGIDLTGGTVSVNTIPLVVPAGTVAGDYLCLAGQTPIPQVPPEVHYLLAQRAAEVIAAATGSSRLASIQANLAQARADATMLLSPRSDSSARPIVARHGPGWGRIGRYGR